METSIEVQKKINDTLLSLIDASGTACDELCIDRLKRYFSELYTWNQRINLTGLRSPQDMVLKHLGDTILLSTYLELDSGNILDIGTGPGVPGLLLKILRPELDVVLVEAVRKKVSFMETVIAYTGLTNVKAIHGRIKGGPKDKALLKTGEFDAVLSQAAMSVSTFIKLFMSLSSVKSIGFLIKGPKGEDELNATEITDDLVVDVIKARTALANYSRTILKFRYSGSYV